MEFSRLLSRSNQLIWRHRVLWLFGILLGLFGGAGGYSGNTSNLSMPGSNVKGTSSLDNLPSLPVAPQQIIPFVIASAIFLIAVAIVISLLRAIFDGGLIALACDADSGEPVTFGKGWRYGLGNMWRVWLIDLVVYLPIILIAAVAGAMAAMTIMGAMVSSSKNLSMNTIIALLAQILPAIVCISLLGIFLGIFSKIAKRISVMEDQNWSASIGLAWSFFTANLGNTAINWIMFGLTTAIANFILAIPLVSVIGIIVATLLLDPKQAGSKLVSSGVIFLVVLILNFLASGIVLSFYSAGWTLFVKWTLHPPLPVAPQPASYYSPRAIPPAPGAYPPDRQPPQAGI